MDHANIPPYDKESTAYHSQSQNFVPANYTLNPHFAKLTKY